MKGTAEQRRATGIRDPCPAYYYYYYYYYYY